MGRYRALLIFIPLLLALGACKNGGDATPNGGFVSIGRDTTILLFDNACGENVASGARVNGVILDDNGKEAFIVRAGATGSFAIDLAPGHYTARGTFTTHPGAIPTPFEFPFTVTKGQGPTTVAVGSNPEVLEAAWERYRAGDFSGALALADGLAGTVAATLVDNLNGWVYAQRAQYPAARTSFELARSGVCAPEDAIVGLAGIDLLGDSGFQASAAEAGLSTVLDSSGRYTSAPQHDAITETDLRITRAFARYLQGDLAGAQADINAATAGVSTEASIAGQDLYNALVVLLGS